MSDPADDRFVVEEPESLEHLRDRFDTTEPERDELPRGASAVLVPVYDTSDGTQLLYTRRADHLPSHPGEVCFPGGRLEPEDDGPLAAALREANEEVHIDPAVVDVWGHLVDFVTFRGTLVSAYVGHVREEPPQVSHSEEVAEVALVPVAHLLDAARYEGRYFGDSDHVVHYWHAEPFTVWGITGELTARFLRQAYGWRPPKAGRPIHDLEDFRPTR